jgi:hypothetical protein
LCIQEVAANDFRSYVGASRIWFGSFGDAEEFVGDKESLSVLGVVKITGRFKGRKRQGAEDKLVELGACLISRHFSGFADGDVFDLEVCFW